MSELSPSAIEVLKIMAGKAGLKVGDIRARTRYTPHDLAGILQELETAALIEKMAMPLEDQAFVELTTLGFMSAA